MLVLSRRENERLQIGEGIEITVIRVQGNRVKLGISAPKTVTIRREELPPESPQLATSAYELTADGIG